MKQSICIKELTVLIELAHSNKWSSWKSHSLKYLNKKDTNYSIMGMTIFSDL